MPVPRKRKPPQLPTNAELELVNHGIGGVCSDVHEMATMLGRLNGEDPTTTAEEEVARVELEGQAPLDSDQLARLVVLAISIRDDAAFIQEQALESSGSR